MANEITYSASLSVSKNGVSVSGSKSKTADMSGSEMLSSVQTFTTTSAAVNIGGCDSVACIQIQNLDSTNTLHVSTTNPATTSNHFTAIPPLAVAQIPGAPTALYAITSAGTIEAFVVAVES